MKKIIVKLKDYKDELEKIDAELLTLPDGGLSKRGKFYCHVTNQQQVGITKNEKLQRNLCRKKYLLFRKRELSKNIANLEHSLVKIHKVKDREAISSFTGAYCEMPDDYYYHPSMKKWLEESSKENLYRKEDLKCYSNNGVPLRSKSEVLIVNQFEHYNLFYWYEAKIKLKNGITIYPDFAIINPYTGKIILWEHFGGLHFDGYAEKMNKKMAEYLKLGYIPFETIIYTFESDALNPERLRYLIENIIL